jgi:hypothetical protein
MEEADMKSADGKLDSRDPAEVMEAIRRLLGAPPTNGHGAPSAPKPKPNPWRHSAFVH